MTGYNKVINDKPFQLVSIIEGQGTVEGKEVKKGDHFVVCSDQKEVDFDGTMTVMICPHRTRPPSSKHCRRRHPRRSVIPAAAEPPDP